MDWGNLLFTFEGRVNRAKWWLSILVFFVAQLIVGIISLLTNGGVIASILYIVVNIAVFIASIFVNIKRLHDRNKTGWFLLIFYLVPGILLAIGLAVGAGGLFTGSSSAGGLGIVLMLASAGVGIWAFVELGCLRGTVGPNQYGPDPLQGRLTP
jgi:uncharacterized membrane protein YhaH (DUF805 family)